MESLTLVREISDPINTIGSAFYFHPDTLTRGKELGLDGFRFYFLGRGGVLGDVEPAVVVSAYGYFSTPLVTKIWNSAKAIAGPRDAARAYLECANEFGRVALAETQGLDAFNDAAEKVTSSVHPSALPLFAGIAAEPLPDDAPARAYRNTVNLRELRGSVHLLAIVAAGLAPDVAHALRRPDDVASFGYEQAPSVSEAHRGALATADERTDELMAAMFDTLDNSQRKALSAGVKAIAESV